jgi:hypothetical protein
MNRSGKFVFANHDIIIFEVTYNERNTSLNSKQNKPRIATCPALLFSAAPAAFHKSLPLTGSSANARCFSLVFCVSAQN